jgi:hypothetical protein
MTTTETEIKPGKFSQAVQKREQQKADLLAKIADLVQTEEAARKEDLGRSPAASAYKLGSEAQKARADRADAEKTLAGVEAELATLGGLQAREQAAQAAVALEAKTKAGKALMKRELAAWAAVGGIFAQLLDARDAIFDVLEERDALITEAEPLLAAIAVEDPDATSSAPGPLLGAENVDALNGAWLTASAYPVQPCPADTGRFLETLTQGTLEAGRDHGPDARTPLCSNQLLELLPDLSDRNRLAQLSPTRVDARRSPGGGGNPGTSFSP